MLKKVKCLKFNQTAHAQRQSSEQSETETETETETEDVVVKEEPLSITINGRHYVTAMISPQMKKEFVIGHLFAEGIIKSIDEIESLQVEDDSNTANLLITHPLKVLAARKIIVSGCGTGTSFLDESKLPKIQIQIQSGSAVKIDSGHIIAAVKSILHSQVHDLTGGLHLVGLFERKNHENRVDKYASVCIVEDIGRHNALDKVIGYGLLREIDFEKTYVACTGRISSEMVLKSSVANIPLLASRGATTSLAIELAEHTGLCICGFVRGGRMNVYTHAERVNLAPTART